MKAPTSSVVVVPELAMAQMALADDPREHILHMFGMEMRSREDHRCQIFPEGLSMPSVPLREGEKIFGIYKDAFYFTPEALVWRSKDSYSRLVWREVVSCSSEHGMGASQSEVSLADGTRLTIPVGELSTGWSGRIGQLYHAMIARWRQRVRDDHFILEVDRFFSIADSPDAIAPNWFPDHPGLAQMRTWLEELRLLPSKPEIYLLATDYEQGVPIVQEVIFLSRTPPQPSQVEHLGFDFLEPSGSRTMELMGPIPEGFVLTSGVWD